MPRNPPERKINDPLSASEVILDLPHSTPTIIHTCVDDKSGLLFFEIMTTTRANGRIRMAKLRGQIYQSEVTTMWRPERGKKK